MIGADVSEAPESIESRPEPPSCTDSDTSSDTDPDVKRLWESSENALAESIARKRNDEKAMLSQEENVVPNPKIERALLNDL